jgi:hypothetical protein
VRAAADYLNGKTDKDMRHNKLVRIFRTSAHSSAVTKAKRLGSAGMSQSA